MKHKAKKRAMPLLTAAFMLAFITASPPAQTHAGQPEWHPANNLSTSDPADITSKNPLKGKIRGNTHPTEAVFGQIFVNTRDGREWIYDGEQWVPHDNTVEAYYEAQSGMKKPKLQLNCPPQAEGGN